MTNGTAALSALGEPTRRATRYAEGGDAMREQVDSAGGWGALMELYAGALA
jgi:hypothetical protein